MIIRLTVRDNDFGEVMDDFVKQLPNILTKLPKGIEKLESKKQLEIVKELDCIDRLLRIGDLSNEEKDIVVKRIEKVFCEFVHDVTCESIAKYLIKNLDVRTINVMEDKWENGEVWYWFQHSGAWLNQ